MILVVPRGAGHLLCPVLPHHLQNLIHGLLPHLLVLYAECRHEGFKTEAGMRGGEGALGGAQDAYERELTARFCSTKCITGIKCRSTEQIMQC